MRIISTLYRSISAVPSTSQAQRLLVATYQNRRFFSAENAESQDNRDPDFVARLKALQPSDAFRSTLNGLQLRKLGEILPELEIFVYLGDKVPTHIGDQDWKKLLDRKCVKDRVNFLEFLALTQRREAKDEKRVNSKAREYQQWYQEQVEKDARGEIGYGPGLNHLVSNPFRNQKHMHQVEGSRIWTAMRMKRPKLIFDLQYFEKESQRDQSALGKHMQYVMSENFIALNPLQLAFANVPKKEQATKWLNDSLGFYGGAYTHQTILPDYTTKGVRDVSKGDREVVYISKYARDMLDGPLTADAYVVCTSMDRNRESLGAARRAKIRAVRFPIQRYVKWQSGPMYLPFPNIARILREVYSNHGDWKAAFEKHIAKRHLMSDEEREEKGNAVSRRKERVQARSDLIRSIQDATGNA